jgi:arsenite/tail-anchored protein-transporting ATPase
MTAKTLARTAIGADTRFLFFTGKGGVGKTTLACATALSCAAAGERVLIVSTDPASNLDEMLGLSLGGEPKEVPNAPGLWAANIDPEEAAESYRRRALEPYVGAVPEGELAKMREALSGACTTEIASFDRFAGLLAGDGRGYDRVVFDTAPTGHTLRLLELPRAWSDFLHDNAHGASCLGPHGGLVTREERFRAARLALEDRALTTIVLVARPDASALREAARTSRELSEIGLTNQRLVINGVFVTREGDRDPLALALAARGRAALAAMPEALASFPRSEVPLRAFDMVGLDALRAVLGGEPPPPDPSASQSEVVPLPRLSALVEEIAAHPTGLVMVMGKGGVGKTTIAAALAVELAGRGIDVHLSTTDPAAHVSALLDRALPHLTIGRIDPSSERDAYVERVMATKGKDLDPEGRALLREDLRSPCTEEVAVFHAFARTVSAAKKRLVILDTAPTGHTVLLLDATGAYHKDVLRVMDARTAAHATTPLMRLRDPSYTKVVLVTLAETTPVSEAAHLAADLRRAGIEPWAWVINGTIASASVTDPILVARAAGERAQIARVRAGLAARLAVVPLCTEEPRGVDALRALAGS